MAASTVNVARVTTAVLDEAPGAPTFAELPVQDGNVILAKIVLPLADHDGSPLTGLTHLNIASATVVGGVAPFEGLTGPEIKASAPPVMKVVEVSPSDAGMEQEHEVNVLAPDGGDQDIAIWVDDDVE